MVERVGVSNKECALIGPLLPAEHGCGRRPAGDNRRWVEMGVFDALLKTLTDMVKRETSADMIDSTVVRAHHCAVGLE